MSDANRIRKKSLWAMKAVTAGALLFAGVSCTSDDDDTSNDSSWNIEEGGDAALSDTDDTAPECSGDEFTGQCDPRCSIHEDADCCEMEGHCWMSSECWEGGCAIPGPFVPPSMTV